MWSRSSLILAVLHHLAAPIVAAIEPGEVNCRYTATTGSNVNYYTCKELADRYYVSVENFFVWNPTIDEDCSNIEPNTEYCVDGFIQQPISTDGFCGPNHGNASCIENDLACCNAETWKCGDLESCWPGTCFSGACMGFPSEYSMDGKCGFQNKGLKCGGKWGSCCSVDGVCGTGETFCGINKCQSGNCTMIIPTPGVSSTPTSVSTPIATPTPGSISPDGSCGGTNKFVCKGSPFGDCCSSSGFCGKTTDHCTAGCQSAFGTCTVTDISPDGTCGGTNKYKCKGSPYGDCCSASGYCGVTPGHCTAGCQAAFGTCTTTDLSPDGSCGGTKKYKCKGTSFGNCCSSSNYCGSSPDHCGVGCQPLFGDCSVVSTTSAPPSTPSGITTDGTCGGSKGLKCNGSAYGNCCSPGGYCGNSVNHCAQGCQKSFSSGCLTTNVPSLNGECGVNKGRFTCAGGPFNGQCCSSLGSCGTTDAHCKTGCQRTYGTCK